MTTLKYASSHTRATVFWMTVFFVFMLTTVADAQIGGGGLGGGGGGSLGSFTVGNATFSSVCQAIGNMVFSTPGLTLVAAGLGIAFVWAAWEHHLRGVGYSAAGVIGFLCVIWFVNYLNTGGSGGVGGL